MLPGLLAYLFLFTVVITLYPVGRPLGVPPQLCGTPLTYHFLPSVWGQRQRPTPSRGCGLQGFCRCLADSSCDLLEGMKRGQWSRLDLIREEGMGRHTACDCCPVMCLQGWAFSVSNQLGIFLKSHRGRGRGEGCV